jgi:hypothetical protein
MFTKFIFTPAVLAAILGAILSLFFSYFPKVRDWFAALVGDQKRLIMLVGLTVIALALYGLNCAAWIAAEGLTCDQAGAVVLVNAWVAAIVANQTAYLLAPGQK